MQPKTIELAIFFEASLVALAWGLGWLLSVPPLDQVHLRWEAAAWGAVVTVPALLAMLGCARSSLGAFRRLMAEIDLHVIPLFRGASYLQLVLLSAVAGIGEEALFRGVLMGWLGKFMNPWLALGISGILFGLGHLITPTYAILAGLLGCYLGSLVILCNNLLVAMVAHALYDYVALNYLIGRKRSGSNLDLSLRGG